MGYKMIKIFFLLFTLMAVNALANDYFLNVQVDKKSVFIGEKCHLKLLFHYADLEDYELPEMKMKDFDIQELNSSDYKDAKGLFVEEVNYALIARSSGTFELGNLNANIEKLTKAYKHFNNRSKYTKKFSVKSNSLILEVKKLPQDITAIGNYRITSEVNTTQTEVGKPILFTLTLQGVGNIKNLDFLILHIKHATSYLIMSSKNSTKHIYTKTFKIVANESYKIPSLELRYFDTELGIVKSSKSMQYSIYIGEKTDKQVHKSYFKNILYLSIIFFMTSLLYFISKKIIFKKEPLYLLEQLKKVNNQDKLYKVLVPYLTKDKELDTLIYALESDNKMSFRKSKKRAKSLVKMMYKSDIITANKEL